MELRLLGPLEVGLAADPVRIAAPKQRSLLAALALHPGRVVGVDALTTTLWGDQPPPSASKLLQTYVSQLRRVLPEPDLLVTRAPGYALDVPVDAVDASRFARLVAAGSHARSVGAPHDAVVSLGEALDLWRGDPLIDLGPAPLFEAEAARLWELQLRALEDWYAVRLDLGEAADVAEGLQALVAEHPLREGLHESLVLALYRSGRQADALAAYDVVRRALRDELGVDPGPALRELHSRLLRQEASLTAAPQPPSRLPMPLTPTIGRERELDRLLTLLHDRQNRLITLTGPGGSGKTRLATVAAARAADSYAGGALLLPLEAVRDPTVALTTLAASLGIREIGPDPVLTLARELHRRELLVVLDNLEQVVAVAPELARLLALAPRLTMLVTSRVVLAVAGERAFPVPPLSVSPVAGLSAQHSPAVSLFCERAGAASSSFALSDANSADIAELCRRLDGLPLAIELAAAQARVLSPAQMLKRLRSRLDTLGPGQRDRPARHHSLRSALDGSYELVSPDGQELFAALSVFAGGFDLAAAEAVCGATPDALTELVDHSLVQVAERPEPRFRLLETVREYAAEHAERVEAGAGAGGLHAAYFLELAQSANLDAGRLTAAPQRLDVVVMEQDNLRAALAWAERSGSSALGLELATALEFFWVAQNPREGMRWFEAFLGQPGAVDVEPSILAHALRAYGGATDIAGDDPAAADLYQRSLALFEELADERGRAVLLHRLGVQEMRRGQLARARELVETSHAIFEQDQDGFARLWGHVQTTGTLGAISRDSEHHVEAYELIGRSCSLAREAGIAWWEGMASAELAAVSLTLSHLDDADLRAREALALAQHDRSAQVYALGVLSAVAAQRGQRKRAGQLWGAVEDADAVAPLGGWRRFRPECASYVAAAAGSEFDQGQAEGRRWALVQAVTLAQESPITA